MLHTVVNISDGSQFNSGFCEINPNSKIPAAVDFNGPNRQKVELFESGSIVLYFAEKHKKFIPSDLKLKAEVMNWIFWQVTTFTFICIKNHDTFLIKSLFCTQRWADKDP